MSPSRVLVVTTIAVAGARLREQVLRETGEADAEVRIVAPATKLSPLKWLANEEDNARGQAEEVAQEAGNAVGAASELDVEVEVGDSDPVQAIEDALRTFPADRLVIVTPTGERANWLEKESAAEAIERFELPVTHLAADGG